MKTAFCSLVRPMSALAIACLGLAACNVYSNSLLGQTLDVLGNGGSSEAGDGLGGVNSGRGGGSADGRGGASAQGGVKGRGGAPSSGGAGLAGTIADSGTGGVAGAPGETGGGSGVANVGGQAGGCSSDCQVLKSSLLHRYSFAGTGTTVADGVGKATGKVVNATLSGNGTLVLPGGTADAYVDLPNGMISSLKDATFEAWLGWGGGNPWQRIFDFGSSVGGEDKTTGGQTYLFLSTSTNSSSGLMRSAYSLNGNTMETGVQSIAVMPKGKAVQVDIVFDDSGHQLSLYVDGAFNSSVALDAHLSALSDVNNWLGRSQFGDATLGATFDEFRIYGAPLSAAQIALSHMSGPNPDFLANP